MRRWSLAVVALVASLLLALRFGSDDVSLTAALAGAGPDRAILLVRAPTVLLAAVAGAGLSAAGAAFQGLLRNPLAEPYVLGVSGGAALGATAVIALGMPLAGWAGAALTPVAAFGGGLAATAAVYFVTRRVARGPVQPNGNAVMLLAGVMVNAICAALVTVAKVLVPPERVRGMLSWLVGSIELPDPAALALAAAYVAVACAALVRDAPHLNLLALGDEAAAALGVEVRALERRVLLAASLAVGAIVSLTGLIGFVGLVVPHALRRAVGPDLRRLLPLSCAAGAALLVLCDLASRLTLRALDDKLPVGAVTALLGAPAFLYLLARPRAA